MAKLDIGGARLEYAEQGGGEPLVFVHGSASDYRTWQAQRDELAKSYRVITYSRRFHWPNEAIPDGADYSMAQQLDDLHAVVRLLGAVPAHLAGHSYGAFLALLLAIRAPGLVRSLVLAEPPVITLFVGNDPKPREILKLLATRPRTAVAIVKFGATGVAPARAAARRGDARAAMRIFGKAVLGAEAFRRLSPARLEQVDANAFGAEMLGSGFLPLQAGQIRDVRAPTLIVEGERSPNLFHRLNDVLAELLPHASRIGIEGASHIVHEDNPTAFNEAVRAFLAASGRSAA